MSGGGVTIDVAGEEVRLTPEGCLYWPREGILAVADFHLGKAETFNRNGLALPAAVQEDDLGRLAAAYRREAARELLFLGDLVHAREGITPELETRFARWLAELGGRATLVAGNHDRGLVQRWPSAWREVAIVDSLARRPFEFRHEPGGRADHFVWCGHLHPCVILADGADRLRLRAFVVRANEGILPAFAGTAGGYNVTGRERRGARVFLLGDGGVHEIATRR